MSKCNASIKDVSHIYMGAFGNGILLPHNNLWGVHVPASDDSLDHVDTYHMLVCDAYRLYTRGSLFYVPIFFSPAHLKRGSESSLSACLLLRRNAE